MAHRVLVVDDEPAIRDTLRMVLEYEGYEVATAGDGRAALAELDAGAADAVLLDIKMSGMDGLETLDRIVARRRRAPGSDDLGARRHRDGRRVHAPGRGRLSREAAPARAGPRLGQERPVGQPPPGRERAPAQAGRGGNRPRRRQRADEEAPGRGRAGGADLGDRADPRRERHGQGAHRARDPRRLPRSPRGPSSRSTAPRSRRS